jgi:Zn-dependent M16 (insulinase) family peptidase
MRGDAYEEMKSNWANGEFIHGNGVRRNLLGGSVYGNCGDPESMMGVKYEDVQSYMQSHVNVANCTYVIYIN